MPGIRVGLAFMVKQRPLLKRRPNLLVMTPSNRQERLLLCSQMEHLFSQLNQELLVPLFSTRHPFTRKAEGKWVMLVCLAALAQLLVLRTVSNLVIPADT